jgi:aryl-alcohol dehydrogenase-like predicted oxidoreductase
MQHQPFGRTGYSVSALGFGGAPIGYLQTDRDRVARILNLMLDNGVNLIDTAASYKGSEELIARTIGSRRDQFVLVSKCGSSLEDLDAPEWTPQNISKTVDRSLDRLKTDHLDVMLLHSCSLDILKQGEVLDALVKAREAGKIRHAGYSGDNEEAAFAATLPDIAVIEMSISIADQTNIESVLPACRKHNVGVIAKRPIANAAWKDSSEQPGMYRGYSKVYHDRLAEMKLDPAALGFTAERNAAWSELALRFTISQPGVHCAIIGTTNPDNARRNLQAAAKGPLPENVNESIRQRFARVNPGTWRGER